MTDEDVLRTARRGLRERRQDGEREGRDRMSVETSRMVVRAVDESCRKPGWKSGLDSVTVDELERIRARMPTAHAGAEAPALRTV
jgi:hypothetical protein